MIEYQKHPKEIVILECSMKKLWLVFFVVCAPLTVSAQTLLYSSTNNDVVTSGATEVYQRLFFKDQYPTCNSLPDWYLTGVRYQYASANGSLTETRGFFNTSTSTSNAITSSTSTTLTTLATTSPLLFETLYPISLRARCQSGGFNLGSGFDRYWVRLGIQRVSGVAFKFGSVASSTQRLTYDSGTGAEILAFELYGYNNSQQALVGTATSSSLFSGQFASSTLDDLAEQCSESSNIFAEGLCMAGVYLFIPQPSTLDQFGTLKQTLQEKFPFSYVFDVTDQWQTLSASSTLNAPVMIIGFEDFEIGTSSPLGLSNIAPNWTFFSSTTAQQYAPDWFFPFMRNIIGLVFIWGTISHIFHRSKTLLS